MKNPTTTNPMKCTKHNRLMVLDNDLNRICADCNTEELEDIKKSINPLPQVRQAHCKQSQGETSWEEDRETEKLITNKNQNSVYKICPKHGVGIDMPLEFQCEDCKLYLSGKDIRQLLHQQKLSLLGELENRFIKIAGDCKSYDDIDGVKLYTRFLQIISELSDDEVGMERK